MKIKFTNSDRTEQFSDAAEITIGREVDNVLILESEGVSRHHGRIFKDENNDYFVEDLGSTNGIKVNGEKISGIRKLNENDLLDFHKEQLQVFDFTLKDETAETIVFSPSATAKISLAEVLTDDNSAACDPVIIAPVAENTSSIKITPTDEKDTNHPKEQDFDKIAEFIQQNTGNLFNSSRAKNTTDKKQESNENSQKKLSNKLFYVILICAVFVIGVWTIKIISPAKKISTQNKQQKIVNYPLYLTYVKENISKNNIFRFSLVIENNFASFTVDDMKSQLKFGPIVKEINDADIAKLKQAIRESNFFKLPPVPEGDILAEEKDFKDLEIFLGPVNKRITLKNRPTPREFMDIEEAINLLAESCNMKTILLSPAELRAEAQNQFLLAEDKFANYETNLTYLKEAINSYTIVIEYLAGISPEPDIRRKATRQKALAEKLRTSKIKEFHSQYITMLSQNNIVGAKQSVEALLKLYDSNSREFMLYKQRLIKIDTILRRTKNKK